MDMKKDFWLERWEREEIGFHQNEVNPHLCEIWPELNLARSSSVFVPLCGKSEDMLWLREQGLQVLGSGTERHRGASVLQGKRIYPAAHQRWKI